MILAAHQPNLMPYLGVWEKFFMSDRFLWADDVQFARQDYQHRVQITSPTGEPKWLIIPNDGSLETMIKDVRITPPGLKTIKGQLESWYPKSSWSRRIIDFIASREWQGEKMKDFNLGLKDLLLNENVFEDLKAPVEFMESDFRWKGMKSERIVENCQFLDCNEYLSGKGGRGYMELNLFRGAGINVYFQEFSFTPYPQKYVKEGFVPGMSILDALLNTGSLSFFVDGVYKKKEQWRQYGV